MIVDRNSKNLRILRFMGCESNQYGSMERYLVRFTQLAVHRGHRVLIVYNDYPVVNDFQKDIEAAGGKFATLKAKSVLDIGFYIKLHRLIRRHDINVVHAYFSPSCHMVMMYSFWMGIKKRVRTSANLPLTTHTAYREITPWFRRFFAIKQRFYSVFSKKIITLSKGMKDEFLSLGVRPSKLAYIHGGVDSDYFAPDPESRKRIRTELGLNDSDKLIGTLARLVPMKGLEYLIEAIPTVKARIPNIKVLVVGDGPLYSKLKLKTEKLNLEDTVILSGHRKDARDILCALDIFVLPSLSEGMSNSLLEAMAMGLPAVVTDIPPNQELIEDGVNGLLVPTHDSDAIGTALLTLINDENMRKEMGARNRALIARKYHVNRRIEAELHLYEQLA